jgi:hypothetical protein
MVTVMSTMHMEIFDRMVMTVMDPTMLKVLMLETMVMKNPSMVTVVVSTMNMEIFDQVVMAVMDPAMMKVLMLKTMVMRSPTMVTVVSTDIVPIEAV